MTNRDYPFTQFVGVDVSKAKLDFAFDDGKASREIKNTEKQIVDKLMANITDPQHTLVVMEATGGYEDFVGFATASPWHRVGGRQSATRESIRKGDRS